MTTFDPTAYKHSTIGFPAIDLNALVGLKAALLDFDNTLYPYYPAHYHAMDKCAERLEHIAPGYNLNDLYEAAKAEVHVELHTQAASHSRHLYFQRVFEKLFQKSCLELAIEFEELYWQSFLPAMKVDERAMRFLKDCKSNNIRTCIVTDLTARIQAKKLVHLGLAKDIDYLVSSEEAGVEKPDPRIFSLALRKLGLKADQVIMVGDSPERDIAGAEGLGIKAFHVAVDMVYPENRLPA